MKEEKNDFYLSRSINIANSCFVMQGKLTVKRVLLDS